MDTVIGAPSEAPVVLGERVYGTVPEDLRSMWDHVRVEASMRSKLPQVEAELARLLEKPKTYAEIEHVLREMDTQVKVADLLGMLLHHTHVRDMA